MSINLTMPELQELKPKITVIGVGGAGGNAVNNMIGAELQGVEFVAANTDAQSLANSRADHKIQLGVEITQGLGAGSRPDIGRAAAEETIDNLEDALVGCHMTFITAGMGGGTGTGAAPVIARLAREKGILTVGVVTKPFQFEGARRMSTADQGIEDLKEYVDTLIIIPNQNLFRVANEKTTFADAFAMADQVLHSGVRGITDLMVMPGLINLDFADIRTVMADMGKAMMGTGEAEGEHRAVESAEAAISNPLLDEVSMQGAKGVIINITGGPDLTLFEVDEAANHIRAEVDCDANIIVGSAFSEDLQGRMRVSVVATGVGGDGLAAENPNAMLRAVETAMANNITTNVVTNAAGDENRAIEVTCDAKEPSADMAAVDHADYAGMDRMGLPVAPEREIAEGLSETDDREITMGDGSAVDPLLDDTEAFVAPEPAFPDDLSEPVGAPDAFAEAALTNGNGALRYEPTGYAEAEAEVEVEVEAGVMPEPALEKADDHAAAQPLSLFERMTSGFRHDDGNAEDGMASRGPAVTTIHPEDIDPPRRAGGNAELGGVKPEDRPVPRTTDDHLEIPSFLRRQAN